MAIVPYSQWLSVILVDVPECPKALAIEAVRQKTIEFCAKSRFWRKELDGFYTIATNSEYEVTTPTDSTVADILKIKVNKQPLEPKTQDDLESMYSEWREVNGCPQYFFLRDTSIIVFVPIPDTAYPVRLLVSLKPTQAAQGVDQIIFEEYKDAIKHGALAYLMQMAEKSWSNPNLSVFHDAKFNDAINRAKSRADHGYNLRKRFRTKPVYF